MQNQNNNTGNQVMNQSIQRGCRTGFLARSNSFAGGVTGVLLLCLWIMPAVPTVNAAAGGTVVAWGWNAYGQTTVPAGLSGVTAVAASYSDTVALKSDGTVVAWGNNGQGQTTVPAGLSGVTAIAAGGYHTVALKNDGTVVAWGDNSAGQTTVPAGLSGVTAIAAGGDHTVALQSDGTVMAWGYNHYGQTTVPAGLSGVTAIAAGTYHTVALVGPARPFAPSILTALSGSTLTLSWPDNATGFQLESTASFTPAILWNPEPGPFQTNGGYISLGLPMTGARKFYRLTKP